MKTTCKIYAKEDIPALVELWNENADWGMIDQPQWERVFYNTPYGPSTLVLLLGKDEELLAQFVFLPIKISVNGEVVDAYKPCAPIMKKTVRKELGLMPFFKMYKFGTKYLVAKGTCLFYMMPDPRWVRGFQLLPGVRVQSFPLWTYPLDKEIPLNLPQGYAIKNISPADEQIDYLWKSAATLHSCSIVRDAHFFSWKLSHRGYELFGITHEDRIIGFAVFLYKYEIKGIAICDVLAESEAALKITIEAARAMASSYKQQMPEEEKIHCEKVTILATPLIQSIVSDMGFEKNPYKFSLAVHAIGKSINKKAVSPENWYVSAND